MADDAVFFAVKRALEGREIGLEQSAVNKLRLLVGEAEEREVMVEGADPDELRDLSLQAELSDAESAAIRLAERLRERGDGPYSAEAVDLALHDLCPIWPFCR